MNKTRVKTVPNKNLTKKAEKIIAITVKQHFVDSSLLYIRNFPKEILEKHDSLYD